MHRLTLYKPLVHTVVSIATSANTLISSIHHTETMNREVHDLLDDIFAEVQQEPTQQGNIFYCSVTARGIYSTGMYHSHLTT